MKLRLKVTLTCSRTDRQTAVFARPPNIYGGIWVISERARRAACGRIGADWRDTNPGISASATVRAIDSDGWHTFTIYGA